MAFQDFDVIQQKRDNERKQKLKKKITIGIVAAVVLVGMIGAAVCVFFKHQHTKSLGSHDIVRAQKAVKTICVPAEYKKTCESSLMKAVEDNEATSKPKDLFKASMALAEKEVGNAIDHIKTLKFETPEKKAAFESCMTLLKDAQEELHDSISIVDKKDFKAISHLRPDLNNYLSAVLSYQETCLDGIPDGEEKAAVEKALVKSKELSSNSLSIVSAISSIMKDFEGAPKRKLLAKQKEQLPSWISNEERRVLKADNPAHEPDVVVAKDGSGKFTTINDALAAIPLLYEGRYIIHVKEGIYDENVIITKKMANITIFGDGSQKSVITGSKNFADGVPTYQTATFVAIGEGFMAQSIGFRNTAGADKLQAVALRVQSDRSIFLNCRVEGFQGALYAQTHRQFYRSTYITGTVDIIFGDASAVFQNCLIYVKKPMENQQNTVTSQGRLDKNEDTGFVIQNCRILATDQLEPTKATIKSFLGRPSKKYSRTIVMETEIADFISPEGWLANGHFTSDTLSYAEYNNKGPGAATEGRVKWGGLKMINKEQALEFTLSRFLQGELWLKDRDVPVRYTLFT